jgi:hypothetical protein
VLSWFGVFNIAEFSQVWLSALKGLDQPWQTFAIGQAISVLFSAVKVYSAYINEAKKAYLRKKKSEMRQIVVE